MSALSAADDVIRSAVDTEKDHIYQLTSCHSRRNGNAARPANVVGLASSANDSEWFFCGVIWLSQLKNGSGVGRRLRNDFHLDLRHSGISIHSTSGRERA